MKRQFIRFGILSICLAIAVLLSACSGGTPATEAEYGPMVVPVPSGPSCTPNPCLGGEEGKDRCILTPLGTSCACNEFYEADGEGCKYAGTRAEIRSPSTGLDLESENPVFTAVILVVGEDNQPIENATLQMGNLVYSPNSAQEFRIADVPYGEENIAIAKAEGYAPTVKRVTWMTAGQQSLVIRPMPVEVEEEFDAKIGKAVDADNVAVQIAGETFTRIVKDENGVNRLETYKGTVNLQVASVDPGEDSLDPAPGEMMGLDLGSQETALISGGMVSVEARDDEGNPLKIRDGRSVNVNFHIPADFEAAEGDELPLWYFNDDTNRWEEEGSCTVQAVTSERRQERRPNSKLECVGEVRHFSWWNLDEPVERKCANYSLQIEVPKGYVFVDVGAIELGNWIDGGVTFENLGGSYCALYDRPAFPVVVGFAIRLIRESDNAELIFLHQVRVEEADLPAEGVSGSPNTTICSDPSVCSQEEVVVTASTFLDDSGNISPSIIDEDGDGAYAVLNSGLGLNSWVKADCNDDDAAIYPGANEVPCNLVDDNCNGKVDEDPKEAKKPLCESFWFPWFDDFDDCEDEGTDANSDPEDDEGVFGESKKVTVDDVDAGDWNRWCNRGCYEKTEEVKGNEYDEDCDGEALDVDGDGELSVSHGGTDCDDFSATTNSQAEEIWGNTADENCDGYQADADGDGFLSPVYCANVELSADEVSLCTDCVDYDATINPDSTRNESYLADSQFYECTKLDEEGECQEYKRKARFCDYFGNADTIEKNSFLLKQDYNCDGVASDLDGDGFTAPGDYSKGLKYAWDCNDLDPRIRPLSVSADPLVPPECGFVEELSAGDESTCDVAAASTGSYAGDNESGKGTKCAKMADGYQPACVDLLDPSGAFTGIFVCSPGHKGLYTTPPNPYGFKKGEDGVVYADAWAPCDGDGSGALPACNKNPGCTEILDAAGQPTGEQKCKPPQWCISGFKFNPAYLQKLKKWAENGADLDGDGENDLEGWSFDLTGTEEHSVCTTACGDLCTNNPCLEPNKGRCSLDPSPPPKAVCSCSPGYFGDDCSICATGFHDGGGGVCVKEGFCVDAYHDGGDGVCVALDSCSLGYELNSSGDCQKSEGPEIE